MPTAILTGQPVPGSSIETDLRSLGFDVRTAADTTEAETLLAAVPGDQRVAVVDARFVGHPHALRLGLTDPASRSPRYRARSRPSRPAVRR